MASFTEQHEAQYGKLMRFWSKRYTALYLVLALCSGYFFVDLWVPPVRATSTIEQVGKHIERHTSGRKRFSSSRRRPSKPTKDEWVVVHLANGARFQMRDGFGVLEIGDTLEVEATPWRDHVLRYRTPTHFYKDWHLVAERTDETNLFPLLVCIASVLLLLPVRSLQFRWIMHFLLLLTVFPWLLSLIGTEGLTLLH
jgi:hypothetical protein